MTVSHEPEAQATLHRRRIAKVGLCCHDHRRQKRPTSPSHRALVDIAAGDGADLSGAWSSAHIGFVFAVAIGTKQKGRIAASLRLGNKIDVLVGSHGWWPVAARLWIVRKEVNDQSSCGEAVCGPNCRPLDTIICHKEQLLPSLCKRPSPWCRSSNRLLSNKPAFQTWPDIRNKLSPLFGAVARPQLHPMSPVVRNKYEPVSNRAERASTECSRLRKGRLISTGNVV